MKTDTLVKKRFEELEQYYDSLLVGGAWNSALSIGAGTSALSLLQKVLVLWDLPGRTDVLRQIQAFSENIPVYAGANMRYRTSYTGNSQRAKVFGEDSIQFKEFQDQFVLLKTTSNPSNKVPYFMNCRELLRAASYDYASGHLFEVRGLIRAEVSDDVLEQAKELLQAGYKGPACVAAGVVLELTLKELCARKEITPAKLETMNTNLCKAGVYNMGMQKQVTAWAERRNRGAHGEWDTFSEADVEDMIRGVTRLVAEYL